MSKNVRRIIGAGLGILMLFSSVSCKKKGKETGASSESASEIASRQEIVALNEGKFVKEDDPYFESAEIPLDLRPETGKTFDSYELLHTTISNEKIASGFYASYTDGSCKNGIVIFNMAGDVVSTIPLPERETLITITNGQNGEILVLTDVESSGKQEEFMRLYKVSKDASLEKILDFPKGVRMSSNAFFSVMDDGSYLGHDYGRILQFRPSGEILKDMTVDNAQHTLIKIEGEWYVAIYEWNDDFTEEVNSIRKIDLSEGKAVGEKIRIDSKWLYNFAQTGDACFHADTNGIHQLDMKGNKESLILSWNETDCVPGIMRDPVFQVPSADEVFYLKTDLSSGDEGDSGAKYSLIHLTRAKKNPYAGRRVLTAAVAGEEGKTTFQEIMNQYNTDPNSTARIQIVDYNGLFGIYGASEKMEDLLDRINQEIMSGNGPDILVNCGSYPRFSTGAKMADMNPYLDGDTGLTRSEYYDNLFRAYETEGKLYQIPICIEISGLAINDSALGNKHEYSIPDLLSASKALPSGMTLFPVYSHEDLLDMLLPVTMGSFVSDEKGVCQFDSKEFCELLEFCKKYGQSKEALGQKGGAWIDPIDYLNMETVAAVPYTFNSFFHYGEYMTALKGTVLFSGYPATEQKAVAGKPILSAGVCAASSGKSEAWDFIRYMLSYETQKKISGSVGGFPVQRQAFAEYIKSGMDQYEARFQGASGSEDDMKILRMLSEKDAIMAGLSELMGKVNAQYSKDPFIEDIIKEEAAAFFAGQKSAEDVSGIIQNRAQIVISERRGN